MCSRSVTDIILQPLCARYEFTATMFNILLCIPTVTDMIVQILLCRVDFLCVLSHYDIIFWAVHKPHPALGRSLGSKSNHHTESQGRMATLLLCVAVLYFLSFIPRLDSIINENMK